MKRKLAVFITFVGIVFSLMACGGEKEPTAQDLFEKVKKSLPYEANVECFRYTVDDPYLPRAIEHGSCEDFVFVIYETKEETAAESIELANNTLRLYCSTLSDQYRIWIMRGYNWTIQMSDRRDNVNGQMNEELWEELTKATGAKDSFYQPFCKARDVVTLKSTTKGTWES